MKTTRSTPGPSQPSAPAPAFRSAAVARMAQMPVATLRIWEQRYRAVRPAHAPSGHRLYSPADMRRVQLLRLLTRQGHAIGSIATLGTDQLQELSRAAEGMGPGAEPQVAPATAAIRLVVVGPALAERLQRPTLTALLPRGLRRLVVFETLAEAAQAASGGDADLLLWHAPELRPEVPVELEAARKACRARQAAVVYRYAATAATRALASAGVAMIREPADDAALGAWLASLQARGAATATKPDPAEAAQAASARPAGAVAPRRFDDATLTAIAGMAPSLACECPRHLAEILMQLASFESYSAGCINRDAADADLHAYLQQVAGTSRALFEAALEHVARHEGLRLPRSGAST
ncbi:MAG: MerR family transcriptional regulator [Burkholderiales bacterium]